MTGSQSRSVLMPLRSRPGGRVSKELNEFVVRRNIILFLVISGLILLGGKFGISTPTKSLFHSGTPVGVFMAFNVTAALSGAAWFQNPKKRNILFIPTRNLNIVSTLILSPA